MNRIVQDWWRTQTSWDEFKSKGITWFDKNSFRAHLISILERVYMYHIAYKTMLYEWESKGMYASSNGGYIQIKDLFSTVGINGLKILGLIA